MAGPTGEGATSCFPSPRDSPTAPWPVSEMPGPAPGKYLRKDVLRPNGDTWSRSLRIRSVFA